VGFRRKERGMGGRLFAAGVVALGLALGAAAAPDWPQFRGPNRDDLSRDKGLLEKWPADGPELLWKAKGVGVGHSSLAVAGERIYTLGNKGPLTRLFALDRDTGKVLWSVEVGKEGGNLGSTPTVDGDRVYAVGQDGDLVCVDVKKERVVWKRNFKKDFGGNCGSWRYTESVLIDGDKLVCTPGAKGAILAALDKKTGEVLWKAPSPFGDATAGYSSVVLSEGGNVRQYVQLTAGGVLGVRASDGKVLWKYDKLGHNTANIPTPIVRGDYVFAAAGYGKGGALLKLVGDGDTVKAQEVYYKPELTNKHGGLLAVGDLVYGDHDDKGTPFCAELKTGKMLWKRKPKDRRSGSGAASVTYADGHLYFLYEDGTLALVKAATDDYHEVSRFKVPGMGRPAWAHPVVVGGKLYLRGGDTVYCYDLKAK
jgi:outer membrane protein assembly factor BamB